MRAVAAANNAGRRGSPSTSTSVASPTTNAIENEGEVMTSNSLAAEVGDVDARPVVASARKVGEEARKALLRP